jgi:hypothetical protein
MLPDFVLLPPEINSARMYAGPRSGSMWAAAAAWDGLAAQLGSSASSFQSTVSSLTGGAWQGPASMTMASAAAPYVQWLTATSAKAELVATAQRCRVRGPGRHGRNRQPAGGGITAAGLQQCRERVLAQRMDCSWGSWGGAPLSATAIASASTSDN